MVIVWKEYDVEAVGRFTSKGYPATRDYPGEDPELEISIDTVSDAQDNPVTLSGTDYDECLSYLYENHFDEIFQEVADWTESKREMDMERGMYD